MNLNRLSNLLLLALLAGVSAVSLARAAEPRVAIHDSELTRALQTVPATGGTPTGEGTTGFQWWPAAWNYFVMPESIKESLRSDGTAYVVVTDADIAAGALLDASGGPRYPILISLAAEAVGDNQLQPLRDYVAAGGTLFVGSSSFTRRPDGTTRGNFGIADIMGVDSASTNLDNWVQNYTVERLVQHRVSANLPDGLVIWQMPSEADEIPFGSSPDHDRLTPHLIWNVAPTSATVLATADSSPMLTVNTHGAGRVIYHAAMQPLLGHGGWAPGMYAYMIFRDSILWAFEAQRAPVTRVSPWPYEYNAALSVRHDFENYQDMIAAIEASAQFEQAHGAKGDYVFCTGELREALGNDPTLVASLRRAVQDYGATIAPHNGGLPNPVNTALTPADFDYWHWGPDEALDSTPVGYASGKDYALQSLQLAYQDTETWLAGLNSGPRIWISPYFNSTREDSLEILEQLDVRAAGDQKVGPFPHWTLSTRTANKRFPYVSVPLSDWYAGAQVAQSMEWHVLFGGGNAVNNVRAAVDFYYDLGALINVYSHSSSAGSGYAGNVAADYVTYATAKPRIWATNAAGIYEWWVKRTPVQITPTLTSSGNQFVLDVAVAGATDVQTAIEFEIPDASLAVLNVLRDGAPAPADTVRVVNNVVRVLVGSTISSVQIQFGPPPQAADDSYQAEAGVPLIIGAPGLLANDSVGFPGNTLTAALVSAPTKGTLSLSADGAFTYTPSVTASGVDTFTYQAVEGTVASQTATVSILVSGNTGALFVDDFDRAGIAPWQASSGSWQIVDGALQGSSPFYNYGYAHLDTSWTNYSVEAEIRLSAGGYGGGLGGRLNSATGAHYGVWLYPEGSHGGQLTVQLVKFRSWTDWSGTAMASAPISSLGTAAHTLRADFQGNRIIVHFDGVEVIDVVDNGFDGRPAYLAGGLTADMWTETTPQTVTIDNLVVMPLAGPPNEAPTATNDTFDAVANQSLVIGAPGILANDSDPEGQAMAAQLASPPSSGSVALNANGSFTYTPASGFTGAATFTYRSHDGFSASAPATVTINVAAANTPPIATNDAYQTTQAGVLQVAASGVLANDSDPEGGALTAQLVGAPTSGSVSLNPDGSFTYTPEFAFSGVAAFTYRVSDGVFTSADATVTITVNPLADVLAIDGFSDPTLAPWSGAMGSWATPAGSLVGTGPYYGYSYAYLAGNWADYSVEAQVRFDAGAYGGGLGGRLNSASGAHYGIWIYPGATPEAPGSIGLVKFRSWTDWNGSFMQQAVLPAVGTSWHSLKATFQANRIIVHFDGVQVLDVTDNGYDNRAAYLSGGVSADMWTNTIVAAMEVDNLVVRQLAAINLPPVAQNDAYTMDANSTLTIGAPGVLANDSDPNANPLTAVLVSAPASGTLTLNADGSFAFTPAPGMTGAVSFTYRANDGQTTSGLTTVNITVNAAQNVLFADDFNDDTVAPWTGPLGTWNITGGALRGTSSSYSYGYAYSSATWTDYSVEGLVQFTAAGAYGGGLGGRLNATTGAHYGAWIYPDGSAGGSLMLRLVKFRTWTDWSGTAMAEVPLAAVGTTPRLLKLSFTGNRIVVSYDGAQVIDVTDNGFDNRPAYLSGGITADLWTYQTNAPMQIDDVLVLALP